MLDIAFVRENTEKVKEACAAKQVSCNVEALLRLDEERRTLLREVEALRAEQKKLGKDDREKAGNLKSEIKGKEPRLKEVEEALQDGLFSLPNIPAIDVPLGKDESENRVVRQWGKPKEFDVEPKDHVALGEELNLIDIEKASEVSGARFAYIKGDAALLEFALVQHTFNVLTNENILKKVADSVEKGYSPKPFVPMVPPVMIRPDVFRKMGRLTEEDKEERYHLTKDDLYLAGSAEHTLGPYHMDETLQEEDLPLRYIGFSTSFRREAGSYGKDTRGIFRVHQFDKLEMETFTTKENSLTEQNVIVALQEYLMQSLEIPYRVVMICAGDMGKPDARQLDIESWIPSENKYRETHTADLMTDYQARRLGTKVKRKNGSVEFLHMNDATAFAIGRTLIAIMENHQEKDGSITIPKVLQKIVGKKKIKKK